MGDVKVYVVRRRNGIIYGVYKDFTKAVEIQKVMQHQAELDGHWGLEAIVRIEEFELS